MEAWSDFPMSSQSKSQKPGASSGPFSGGEQAEIRGLTLEKVAGVLNG